jgi:hypothetical protein
MAVGDRETARRGQARQRTAGQPAGQLDLVAQRFDEAVLAQINSIGDIDEALLVQRRVVLTLFDLAEVDSRFAGDRRRKRRIDGYTGRHLILGQHGQVIRRQAQLLRDGDADCGVGSAGVNCLSEVSAVVPVGPVRARNVGEVHRCVQCFAEQLKVKAIVHPTVRRTGDSRELAGGLGVLRGEGRLCMPYQRVPRIGGGVQGIDGLARFEPHDVVGKRDVGRLVGGSHLQVAGHQEATAGWKRVGILPDQQGLFDSGLLSSGIRSRRGVNGVHVNGGRIRRVAHQAQLPTVNSVGPVRYCRVGKFCEERTAIDNCRVQRLLEGRRGVIGRTARTVV